MKMKKVALSHIRFRDFVDSLMEITKRGARFTDECAFRRVQGYAVELFVPWDEVVADLPVKTLNLPPVEFEDEIERDADGNPIYTESDLELMTIADLQTLVGNTKTRAKAKLIKEYFESLKKDKEDAGDSQEEGEEGGE